MPVISIHRPHPLTAALLAALLTVGCASTNPPTGQAGAQDGQSTTSQRAAEQADDASASESHAQDAQANRTAQVPGFFRMKLGSMQITALYDGSVEIDAKLLKGASVASIAQLLRQGKQPSAGGVQTAVNAFLLDDGSNVVLVDTGAADTMGASAGQLLKALAAAGYDETDVTAVLLTHLHPDHAGGLLKNGDAAFSNAQVYAAKEDADFWLSEEREKSAPEAAQKLFAGARNAVAPYQQSGRFHTFSSGALPIEGFDAVALHGHTPGHSGFVVNSGGEKLLFWGDVVHSHTTQFANPAIALEFDTDQRKARAARIKVMRDAARSGEWIAGAHMPFPGIGRVLTQGKGYRWLPLDYSQAQSGAAQRQP